MAKPKKTPKADGKKSVAKDKNTPKDAPKTSISKFPSLSR